MKNITRKQKEVLDYITQYQEHYGFSPTQIEIKEHFGLKSLGSVQDYLKYLKEAGLIESQPSKVRGLKTKLDQSGPNTIINLPMLGKVAAGIPIEYLAFEKTIEVPPQLVPNPTNSFALEVKGDSMIEEGIIEGDYILLEKCQFAENHDLVVASMKSTQEATLKRIFFHPQKNQIELRASNSKYSSILISPDDLSVEGKVFALFRKY